MGFLGILETRNRDHVPGTVILNEQAAHSEDITHGLKHVGEIVLVPQPSNDPNDPLNWSLAKKRAVFTIILFGTTLYAAVSNPLLNTDLIVLSEELNVTLSDITLLTGYQILVPACSATLISAISRKFGKRALFVFSSLFALIGTIIGACAETYRTLEAGRIVQGLAITAYESICFVVVGDLFFLHERGLYTTLVSFVLISVANLSSVVTGSISEHMGWRALFFWLIAATGLQLLLTLFFVPETTYNRSSTYNLDVAAGAVVTKDIEQRVTDHVENVPQTASAVRNQDDNSGVPAKKAYWQDLRLWSGIYSHESFFQLFIAPFAVSLNIAVAYNVLLQSWALALLVAMAYTLAQIFGVPPYNLSPQGIGYLSFGPFIGGFAGMVLLGIMNDRSIKYLARKNHGVYEPEYRLILCLLGFLVGLGLFIFGYVVQSQGSQYVTATVHGIIMVGITGIVGSGSSYMIDAYRGMSSEIFILGMCVKNFLFYALSFFMNDWLARSGAQTVYFVLGATGFAIMLPLPLMYIFGKQYRSFWFRHNLLAKLHIATHAEY
jgi:MFS family permease